MRGFRLVFVVVLAVAGALLLLVAGSDPAGASEEPERAARFTCSTSSLCVRRMQVRVDLTPDASRGFTFRAVESGSGLTESRSATETRSTEFVGNVNRGCVIEPTLPADYALTGAGLSGFRLDNQTTGATAEAFPALAMFRRLDPGSRTVRWVPSGGARVTALTCTNGEQAILAQGRVVIDLAQGEDVSCTFTVTLLARIRLTLDVRPDGGSPVTFNTAGVGPAATTLDDDGGTDATRSNTVLFSNLLPGERSISITSSPDMDPKTFTCTPAAVSGSPSSVTVSLLGGEDVTCTAALDRRGQITIIEDRLPDGPGTFTFRVAAAPFIVDDDPVDTSRGNTIVYRKGATVVSAALRSRGGLVFPDVPPGERRTIVVELTSRAGSAVGVSRTADLNVRSGGVSDAIDVVRARAIRG